MTQLPIKPHLGSDSESSDDEQGDEEKWSLSVEASCKKIKPWGEDSSDDEGDAAMAHSGESGELSREPMLSEKTLKISRVPEHLYKSLSALNIARGEHLKTFYVPPAEAGRRGT